MANEAAVVCAGGVAKHPADIDVVLANGYGFPRRLGGPVHRARQLGQDRLREKLEWLSALSGPGFRISELSSLYTKDPSP